MTTRGADADDVPATVVVPTRDRPQALARCLAALREQVGVALEVVVVDDGSRDPEAVERALEVLPGARLVRLEGGGPAAARNAGVEAARGRVVLMTDDDCVPAPGWAAALTAAVAQRSALAAGRTEFDATRPLVAASETIVRHAERRGPFVATRNLAVPRELALAVPFDERFREAGGEDREWGRRLAARGTPVVHVGAARLRHDPELDVRRFWRQHVRYGRAARADPAVGAPGPQATASLVVAGFSRGVRVGLLVVVAQAATLVGYAGRRHL